MNLSCLEWDESWWVIVETALFLRPRINRISASLYESGSKYLKLNLSNLGYEKEISSHGGMLEHSTIYAFLQ